MKIILRGTMDYPVTALVKRCVELREKRDNAERWHRKVLDKLSKRHQSQRRQLDEELRRAGTELAMVRVSLDTDKIALADKAMTIFNRGMVHTDVHAMAAGVASHELVRDRNPRHAEQWAVRWDGASTEGLTNAIEISFRTPHLSDEEAEACAYVLVKLKAIMEVEREVFEELSQEKCDPTVMQPRRLSGVDVRQDSAYGQVRAAYEQAQAHAAHLQAIEYQRRMQQSPNVYGVSEYDSAANKVKIAAGGPTHATLSGDSPLANMLKVIV